MDISDLFSQDSLNTIVNGIGTVGSAFQALSPIINAGAQLGLGFNGTQNAEAYRAANQQVLNNLNDMFGPTGDYANELRRQMERKDAAAGRRSQYGTRETELMTNLAKQKSNILNSAVYQNYLARANMSPYAPLAGAIGNLTSDGRSNTGQVGGSGRMGGANNISSLGSAANYLSNLFGPGAEASIAAGLGGAGSALGASPALGGITDTLGSMFGTGSFLPGYTNTGAGIFGQAPLASQATEAATGGNGISDLLGTVGNAGNWLGGAGAFGGAGSALSGMGGGSLMGTVGGADTLGGLLGGTGFLPSYGAAGGTTASGLFGGAGAAGAAGGEAAGAGAAGAGAGLGGLAGFGAVAAIPILGMLGAFDDNGTPFSQANDAWTNAIAKDPSLLQRFGQGDVNNYMQGMFGGNNWTPEQYDKAKGLLSAAAGGGSFFGNFLGGVEPGQGG